MSFPMRCSEIVRPGVYQFDYEKFGMNEVCSNPRSLLTACPSRREDKLIMSYATCDDDNTTGKPLISKVKVKLKKIEVYSKLLLLLNSIAYQNITTYFLCKACMKYKFVSAFFGNMINIKNLVNFNGFFGQETLNLRKGK